MPYGLPGEERGVVEAIVIAAEAEAEPVAGGERDGDRGPRPRRRPLRGGRGTFSPSPGGGRALTLIEGEVLDELGLAPPLARRNIVTRGIRLNPLVGARFTVGGVVCAGTAAVRAMRPLERLAGPGPCAPWSAGAACAPTCSPTARSPSGIPSGLGGSDE